MEVSVSGTRFPCKKRKTYIAFCKRELHFKLLKRMATKTPVLLTYLLNIYYSCSTKDGASLAKESKPANSTNPLQSSGLPCGRTKCSLISSQLSCWIVSSTFGLESSGTRSGCTITRRPCFRWPRSPRWHKYKNSHKILSRLYTYK